MIELTQEQGRAVADGDTRVLDVATKAKYVLVREDVFERLNLLRLFAVAAAANLASARVLEKAGYHKEGVLRCAAVKFGVPNDQLLFARINPNWRGTDINGSRLKEH